MKKHTEIEICIRSRCRNEQTLCLDNSEQTL